MKRYFCCCHTKPPQIVEPSRPFVSSSKLISQGMPATVEGCREYESQLQYKLGEIDRKLKDIQNMIKSSIASNMSMRASKFIDMGKEVKMQRDVLVKRIHEVQDVQRMLNSPIALRNPMR